MQQAAAAMMYALVKHASHERRFRVEHAACWLTFSRSRWPAMLPRTAVPVSYASSRMRLLLLTCPLSAASSSAPARCHPSGPPVVRRDSSSARSSASTCRLSSHDSPSLTRSGRCAESRLKTHCKRPCEQQGCRIRTAGITVDTGLVNSKAPSLTRVALV